MSSGLSWHLGKVSLSAADGLGVGDGDFIVMIYA